MHVFWLNSGLMLEPENEVEGAALELLAGNLKPGRPKRSDEGILPQPEVGKERVA